MPVKILIIGIIKKGDSVLLRRKFAGSKPYKETWYSFGCELVTEEDPAETFAGYVKNYLGIIISSSKYLSWDTETKEDHDGIRKQFIYLQIEFEYVSGELNLPKELERAEFIQISNLPDLDLVPPSVKMFKHLGYLECLTLVDSDY